MQSRPEAKCKQGAKKKKKSNVLHSHQCDHIQFELAHACHMDALVITLVITKSGTTVHIFSLCLLFEKETKRCQYSLHPVLPAAELFVLYLHSEISHVS